MFQLFFIGIIVLQLSPYLKCILLYTSC